jgi:putative ABC transport system substrate-binding protein
MSAARAVLEQPGQEPVLLALLSRLEYEQLRPTLAQSARPIGVLLSHPAFIDQLALIDAVLPGRRNISIVASPQALPLLSALNEAAQQWSTCYPSRNTVPWQFNIAEASDAKALTGAIQKVLPHSNALLVLSNPVETAPATALTLLQAAAKAGLPVFTNSEAVVSSGALAALVPNQAELAQQAQNLVQRLHSAAPGTLLLENPHHFVVRTNSHVARQLNLVLPTDDELNSRLSPPN